MTVCVAAIAATTTIFGATDRMITFGDIEYEPEQTKIYPISTSIVALTAGDSSTHAAIFYDLQAFVNARITKQPSHWWAVLDVANLYFQYFNAYRSRTASNAILAPLGLDEKNFAKKRSSMPSKLAKDLTDQMSAFRLPDVEVIFAGVDPTGPHLYVLENMNSFGEPWCHITYNDAVGFAAIGAGKWHANSQFMLARHTRFKEASETLLLTHFAKKRAEVAPGVGTVTDMFSIGPQLGSYITLWPEIISNLDRIYTETEEQRTTAENIAKLSLQVYLGQLAEQAAEAAAQSASQPQPQTPPPTPPEPPASPPPQAAPSDTDNNPTSS